mmetsp:Transcript_49002/g.149189  ORF Transcript_49002/g.149189 Transcript_49002/m.149189 type:complete len:260 (-) Transcript_49002:45-824(-)
MPSARLLAAAAAAGGRSSAACIGSGSSRTRVGASTAGAGASMTKVGASASMASVAASEGAASAASVAAKALPPLSPSSASPSSWESCRVSKSSSRSSAVGHPSSRRACGAAFGPAPCLAAVRAMGPAAPWNEFLEIVRCTGTNVTRGATLSKGPQASAPVRIPGAPSARSTCKGGRPGSTVSPSTNMTPKCATGGASARVRMTVSAVFEITDTSALACARWRATSTMKVPTPQPKGTHCTSSGGKPCARPSRHAATSLA